MSTDRNDCRIVRRFIIAPVFFLLLLLLSWSVSSMAAAVSVYAEETGENEPEEPDGPTVPEDYDARIIALDYGNCGMVGDAVLVESAGKYILMDTGYTDSPLDHSQSSVILYLKEHGIRNLDLYLSHYHNDHYFLLTTIMRDPYFNVGTLYLPKADNLLKYSDPKYKKKRWYHYFTKNIKATDRSWEQHSYTEIMETIEELGINTVILTKGSHFTVGEASFDVLWHNTKRYPRANDWSAATSFLNNESLVTMVKLGGVRFLTCGDLEAPVEKELAAAKIDLRAEICKSNHHSCDTSNTASFFKAVRPQYVFSTGGSAKFLRRRAAEFGFNFAGVKRNGQLTYTIKDGEISFECTKHYTTKSQLIRLASGIKELRTYQFATDTSIFFKPVMIPKGAEYCTDKRGWITSSKKKYYYDDDGVLVKGPCRIGSYIYFFDRSNGQMKTGWITDETEEGKRVYYAGKSGVCLTGWQTISSKKYYFHEDGHQQPQGTMELDGAVYTFGEKNVFDHADFPGLEQVPAGFTGFGSAAEEGIYCYFEKGTAVTGWKTIDKKKYYFDPQTFDMARGITRAGSKDYYFDLSDGRLRTGWISTETGRLYADKNGVLLSGLATISGKRYGFDAAAHTMLTGVAQIGGRQYVFDEKGVLYWLITDSLKTLPKNYTGLVLVRRIPSTSADAAGLVYGPAALEDPEPAWADGTVYNYSKGKRLKGWKTVNGRKCYFVSSGGKMAKGRITIKKKSYYFSETTGELWKSGWVTARNGNRYYARSKDNSLLSGWQKIGGKKYYFNTSTKAAAVGLKTIGKKKYFFDETGAMETGEILIDHRVYVFGKDGALVRIEDEEPEQEPAAETPEQPAASDRPSNPAAPEADQGGRTDGGAEQPAETPQNTDEPEKETEPPAQTATEAPSEPSTQAPAEPSGESPAPKQEEPEEADPPAQEEQP